MKIMLVNAPLDEAISKPRVRQVARHLFFNSPPLGIASLAAVMEREGASVGIIDAAVEGLTTPETLQRIFNFKPDVVGFTSTTSFFMAAVRASQALKKSHPRIPVILGGSHVSANPGHALSFSCFDIGVIGEGEETIKELIPALLSGGKLDSIRGLVCRLNGKLHRTPSRPRIEDLDSLPFPARHLLKLDLYKPQPNDEYRLPKTAMITSRGCPFSCIFCDKHVFGKNYRAQSPQRIIREVEHVHSQYGIRDVAFVDSCFGPGPERLKKVVAGFKKHPLPVSWTCSIRCNAVTEEILREMREVGCWRVRVGIESGSDRVLKFIKKGITTADARRASTWASRVGLRPKAFFMIGHLIDNRQTIEETIRFARSLPFHDITVQINTPMFGTAQYDMASRYGHIDHARLSDLTYFEPVFIPQGMTKKELDYLFRKIYRSFYLRPITIWRHLKKIRRISDLRKYIRALKLVWYLMNPLGKIQNR